jgi:hypothetical protein
VCLTPVEWVRGLSFDEDRPRRGTWCGDWDWLCDCSRQNGRGDKGDCDEVSEHIVKETAKRMERRMRDVDEHDDLTKGESGVKSNL